MRREEKAKWRAAWNELWFAAKNHNAIGHATRMLSAEQQVLALCEAYEKWDTAARALVAASGRQLRPEQAGIGKGWCQLWHERCFCERVKCEDCGLLFRDTEICWLCETPWASDECLCLGRMCG